MYFLSLIKYNRYIRRELYFSDSTYTASRKKRKRRKYKTENTIFNNFPAESNTRFKRNAGGIKGKEKCSQTSIAGTEKERSVIVEGAWSFSIMRKKKKKEQMQLV